MHESIPMPVEKKSSDFVAVFFCFFLKFNLNVDQFHEIHGSDWWRKHHTVAFVSSLSGQMDGFVFGNCTLQCSKQNHTCCL